MKNHFSGRSSLRLHDEFILNNSLRRRMIVLNKKIDNDFVTPSDFSVFITNIREGTTE